MDSASTVATGPAAARDRAQKTLRQARAASKRRKEGSAVPECAAEFRKNGNCNRAKVKEFTSMTGDSDVKVAETLLANNEWNVAQALECLRSVPVEEGNLFPSDDGQKTVNRRVFRGTLGVKATKPWRYLMCLPRSMRGIQLAVKSMPKKMQGRPWGGVANEFFDMLDTDGDGELSRKGYAVVKIQSWTRGQRDRRYVKRLREERTMTSTTRRAASPVDQNLLEESWSICVKYLGIQSLAGVQHAIAPGLLGFCELMVLASTNRSLKHMLSGELDSRCSVWHRCCANETTSRTARIMSAAARNGKNRHLACMLQDPHCQLVLRRKKRVLLAAVQHSNEGAVAMLLSAGANVNARDKEGEMPLLKAIDKDNLNIAEMLLENGADVHSVQNGTLPLHMAAYHRSTTMVNLLLQYGAPVNARDSSSGATALHDVCQGCGCGAHRDAQSVVVLEQLLQGGIHVNAVDWKGRPALYLACARGDGAAAKMLLSKGAEVDAVFRIARHSNSAAIKVLWRVLRAAYPLHHACSNGRLQDVKGFLREGDVDVNARDHKGRVPLHEASRKGHLHVVRVLLAAHAQVDVKDKKNRSPLQFAAFESHREVFLALEIAGADAFSNMRLLLNKDSSFSSPAGSSSSSSSSEGGGEEEDEEEDDGEEEDEDEPYDDVAEVEAVMQAEEEEAGEGENMDEVEAAMQADVRLAGEGENMAEVEAGACPGGC